MAKNKEDKNVKPKVHKDLKGFDIEINSFGEIQMNYDMDKINAFLNDNVDDKKLRDRDPEDLKKRPEELKKKNYSKTKKKDADEESEK